MTQFDNIIKFAPSQNPQDPVKVDPVLPTGIQPVDLPKDLPSDYVDQTRERLRKAGDAVEQRDIDGYLNSLSVAIRTNPDDYAEALYIGKQLGIDPSAVAENRDVLREVAKRRSILNTRLQEHSPLLAESLKSVDFARLVHDDLEKMSTIERLSNAWTSGLLKVDIGLSLIHI